MKCPLCRANMSFSIASDKGLYSCPTSKSIITKHSHCMTNADGSILRIMTDKWIIFCYPDIYDVFSYDKGYNHIISVKKFPIISEEQLVNKIKLILLFS